MLPAGIRGEAVLGEEAGGLMVRAAGEPCVVGRKIDPHAYALGVVEDAGVGGDVGRRAPGVLALGIGLAEDGGQAGLAGGGVVSGFPAGASEQGGLFLTRNALSFAQG